MHAVPLRRQPAAGRLADPALLGIYLVAALLMVALTIAVTLRRAGAPDGVDLRDAAFGALVAAFPNAGFMGVPLLVALFGDAAAGPVIGAIVIDLVVTSTLCLALAQAQSRRSRADDERACAARGAVAARRAHQPAALGDRPRRRLRGVGRELPAPVAQIVRMLGDSATPVALFTIGAVLLRAGHHVHTRTPVGALPAGGADQAARPPGAGVRARPGGARARRAGARRSA